MTLGRVLHLDGSPELALLALELYRSGGRRFSRDDVAAAIVRLSPVERTSLRRDAFVDEYIGGLVRREYLVEGRDGLLGLGDRARRFAVDHELELASEIDAISRDVTSLFDDEPRPSRAPSTVAGNAVDIHEVTRGFLLDVLRETDLPVDMIETIVETYESRGRLVMSEDGGRYEISLLSGGRR